jgi:hypothetical protein
MEHPLVRHRQAAKFVAERRFIQSTSLLPGFIENKNGYIVWTM